MGLLLALIYVVGAAFSWGFPRFAGTLFLAGGVLALLASANSLYGDLAIWGSVSIGLAVMAFLGAREVRRPMLPMPYQPMPPYPLQHRQGHWIERQPAPLLLPAPAGMQPYAAPPYLPPNPARLRRNQLIAAGVVAVVLVGLSLGVFTTGAIPIDSVRPAPASTSAAHSTAVPQPRAVMIDDPAVRSSDSSAPVMAVDAPEAPPRVTRAWLVGTWGPNLGAGAGSACDTDGTVTFEASGRYSDGGSRGRFVTANFLRLQDIRRDDNRESRPPPRPMLRLRLAHAARRAQPLHVLQYSVLRAWPPAEQVRHATPFMTKVQKGHGE